MAKFISSLIRRGIQMFELKNVRFHEYI